MGNRAGRLGKVCLTQTWRQATVACASLCVFYNALPLNITQSRWDERVAICLTGTWRSFGNPIVYESIATNIVGSLENHGAVVGLFYFVDSAGVSLREVLPALERLPPRSLAIDMPPMKVPSCLRATRSLMSSFIQFAQIRQCYDTVEQDEQTSTKRWSWLMRLRPDREYRRPFGSVKDLDSRYLYMPPKAWDQVLPFPTASWGFSYQCFVADDRFALVPRELAKTYFDAVADICVAPYFAALVCFTTHIQYMLFRRLRKEGVSVRFLTTDRFDAKDVHPARYTDPGYVRGPLSKQSEARYQALVEAQPLAFGNGVVGASIIPTADKPSAELLWNRSGPPLVTLEPSSEFKDHVQIHAIVFCLWEKDAVYQSDGYLQIRIYRPCDEERVYWRLIGSQKVLPTDVREPAGIPGCLKVSLRRPIFAAPGDCIGYVVDDRFAALAMADSARGPLVSRGTAGIGEFDIFTRSTFKSGFAIRVELKHFDHQQVGPLCFHDDKNRIFIYEYCCDMEAQGPEGNAFCWVFDDGLYAHGTYTYNSCCIHHGNFASDEEIATWPASRGKGFIRSLARMLTRSKGKLRLELERLETVDNFKHWPPYRRAAKLYSRPWWPEEAPEFEVTKIRPRFTAEVLRSPQLVCDTLFGKSAAESILREHIILNYCTSFTLLHARLIAAFVSNTDSTAVGLFQAAGLI